MNILIAVLFNSLVSLNNTDTNYVVSYKQEIYDYKMGNKSLKIAVPPEYKDAVGGKDSLVLSEVLKDPFILLVEMKINSRGEYKMKEWSENPFMKMKTQEKLFREKKFFSDETPDGANAYEVKFKKVEGAKSILSIDCEKFIVEYEGKDFFEVWATNKLPQTITGFHRLPQFGYAVLEISRIDGLWKRTATSIQTIVTKEDIFTMDTPKKLKYN